MIDFKDITLQDKDTITGYTMNSCRRNCDLLSPTPVVGDSCIIPNLRSSTIGWFLNSGPVKSWRI